MYRGFKRRRAVHYCGISSTAGAVPGTAPSLQGQHVIAETRRLSAIELGICPGFGDHKRK